MPRNQHAEIATSDKSYYVVKVMVRVTAASQQAAEQKVMDIFMANPSIQRVRAEAE